MHCIERRVENKNAFLNNKSASKTMQYVGEFNLNVFDYKINKIHSKFI